MASTASSSARTGATNPSDRPASLIFLHGLGDTGAGWSFLRDACSVRPSLRNLRTLFPTAPSIPVTLNGGMRMPAWFDLYGLVEGAKRDTEGLEASRKRVEELVAKEVAAGVPPERIVIGGFSQGGAVALSTGLQFKSRLAGIIALSTWLPVPDQAAGQKLVDSAGGANKATPIFFGHGDEDQLVSLDWAKTSSRMLKTCGCSKVEFHTYQGVGHGADDQEIEDLLDFVEKSLNPTSKL